VEKTAADQRHKLDLYLMKSLTNQLLLKQYLYPVQNEESTHPLNLILVNFNSMITDLVKTDVKKDDEDQKFVIMFLIALVEEV